MRRPAVDERGVGEGWDVPFHRIKNDFLAESVVKVVIAADNVGDAHIVIVYDDGEHVGWGVVAAQDDEIVELVVFDGDCALDFVVDCGFAAHGGFDADDGIYALGRGVRVIAPFSVVSVSGFAHFREFFGGAVAFIGFVLGEKFVGDFDMPLAVGELGLWFVIVVQA